LADEILRRHLIIALAPAFADAQFSYGTALHFVNRSEDALVHFEKAIALHPKFVAALNNRGLALARLKRFTEALASYDKALAIQPSFGDAHNNRGKCVLTTRLPVSTERLRSDRILPRRTPIAAMRSSNWSDSTMR
jgi:tetratricopeptide (TPR) repeat protein